MQTRQPKCLRTSKIKYAINRNNPYPSIPVYSPEVLENLKQRGIDPAHVTLQQLFHECLAACGSDTSLMSGAETRILISYAKIRKYLLEHYPQTRQEAQLLGKVWTELPEESVQINLILAKDDPKKKLFFKLMVNLEAIYEKICCSAGSSQRI